MSKKKVVSQQTTDIQNALTTEKTKSQNEKRKDTIP